MTEQAKTILTCDGGKQQKQLCPQPAGPNKLQVDKVFFRQRVKSLDHLSVYEEHIYIYSCLCGGYFKLICTVAGANWCMQVNWLIVLFSLSPLKICN